MHLNVGKEFLPGILQAGPEEIDYIIDNEESVVIMQGGTDINRWAFRLTVLFPSLRTSSKMELVDSFFNSSHS